MHISRFYLDEAIGAMGGVELGEEEHIRVPPQQRVDHLRGVHFLISEVPL